MAKNFNSVSFSILVLVLMMASTGIFKSKALAGVECPMGSGCHDPHYRQFFGSCGMIPFTGSDSDCCACCTNLYGTPPICWAAVEGTTPECNCYDKAI
ncbi:unnamed protein product [Eruca vesicaria subsp. sativa]|uniref:Uncharacterized protein n=1 Tax=Eruca vesicaria subsp. sativa TaxID=29727 RepID=A0ABC8J927_ERUVS|nr:unnamed protein product [Eruca vesicaria subsp. sativa]